MNATSLEARVIELEKRCRRLQIAGIGLGGLVLAACLSGAIVRSNAVLRAERFEFVNAHDEVRGRLELDGPTPRLVLVSPENDSLVALCAGPSVIEHQPGKGWFAFKDTDGESRMTGSGFEVDEHEPPRKHGLATLTLGAASSLTELVVDRTSSSMSMDANGPMALVITGTAQDKPFSSLQLLADAKDENDFGHAEITVGATGGRIGIGANDVDGVELHYGEGQPSLELKDATEATLFHAP